MSLPRFLTLLFAVLWLSACATNVPAPIREAPAAQPLPDEVRADPTRFQGQPVRWGGVIASVSNRADETGVEVVARPLSGSARPQEVDRTYGRFLARVPGFLDPAVYAPGREITVTGTISGLESRPVGEYAYPYVVVDVTAHYLWAVREPIREPAMSPWWYDPWYPYHPLYGPWRRW